MKPNEHIRLAIHEAGIPQWEVSHALGVSEGTFIRWLRFPLPEEKERRILEAIEHLKGVG